MLITDSMPLGEKLVSSIAITILGMAVVFVVLIIIAYSLDLLRVVLGETDKKQSDKKIGSQEPATKQNPQDVYKSDEDIELVVLLTAAIAAKRGSSADDFFVKSIRKLPQRSSIWASVGRQQQMSKRL